MTDVISHSRQIEAPPEAVFTQIIDIEGLPSWNDKIKEVVERPDRYAEGGVWTVRVKAAGAASGRARAPLSGCSTSVA